MKMMGDIKEGNPLIGWRIWRCRRTDDRERELWKTEYILESLWMGEVWPPNKPIEAYCDGGHMGAPHPACKYGCGIHARMFANTMENQIRAIEKQLQSLGNFTVAVVGTVRLWGCVIIGRSDFRDGQFVEDKECYRASFAYPISLCVLFMPTLTPEDASKRACELAWAYNKAPTEICRIYRMGSGWPAPVKIERKDVLRIRDIFRVKTSFKITERRLIDLSQFWTSEKARINE